MLPNCDFDCAANCCIRLFRVICCSIRWIVAVKCEFSTYKSFTSKSALANLVACSLITMLCASNRLRNSLSSCRCWCHVSKRIYKKFIKFTQLMLIKSRFLDRNLRYIIVSVYCCCCRNTFCKCLFFICSFSNFCAKLGWVDFYGKLILKVRLINN
jgi:hypothetical protein